MKRHLRPRDVLPLARAQRVSGPEPTGEAFRPEWIDFGRGIRVGNLQPEERITQILKYHLERRYQTPFVTDRWGRGVHWQWICWLPRSNRQAKSISHAYNFGCAKLFISVDRGKELFQCGLQVERGHVTPTGEYPGTLLQEDWDWHRLMKHCRKGSELDREIGRLLGTEGFVVEVGEWGENALFDARSFVSSAQIRSAARKAPPDRWAGFQLYYPMPASELKECTGAEVVRAILAAFGEVLTCMNLCMQVRLEPVEPPLRLGP